MSGTLLIINDPPTYGTERAHNVLRLARMLVGKDARRFVSSS